jgi:hypothetical protein
MTTISLGYATTGVNVPIFRRSSLTTWGELQYAAFYDREGRMVLARRRLGTEDWETRVTAYTGNVQDVHNAISLGLDGAGTLHVSWDHHSHALNYCRSVAPGSLELTPRLPLTGQDEEAVTYPQFYPLPGGDLLFQYRNVVAGSCAIFFRRWDLASGQWRTLPGPVLSGEGVRGPYWQTATDVRSGAIHLSWCWAELDGRPGYEPNHDVCYARSPDGGQTWQRSDGRPYELPITLRNAEVAVPVPEHTNLGNMTSMTVDSQGHPFIAQHWQPEGESTEQLFLVFHDGATWQVRQVGHRAGKPLDLTAPGGFTLSRPLIVLDRLDRAGIVFRDHSRSPGAMVAVSQDADYREWEVRELTGDPLGEWEPTCDWELWQRDHVLHLFLQRCHRHCPLQYPAPEVPPEPVRVLEWRWGAFQEDFGGLGPW